MGDYGAIGQVAVPSERPTVRVRFCCFLDYVRFQLTGGLLFQLLDDWVQVQVLFLRKTGILALNEWEDRDAALLHAVEIA